MGISEKEKSLNLRAWLDAHEMTTQHLTDYLNGLGFSLSRRTVEGWFTVSKQRPEWLAPLLRQRDALNAIYAEFGALHDAVIGAAATYVHGTTRRGSALADYLNAAGDRCDNLEGLFAQHLTDRERGELPDEEFARKAGIPVT